MKLSMFYSLTTNFGIHHKTEGSKRPVACYKVMSESSATTLSAAGDMPKPESTFTMTSLKCYIYMFVGLFWANHRNSESLSFSFQFCVLCLRICILLLQSSQQQLTYSSFP